MPPPSWQPWSCLKSFLFVPENTVLSEFTFISAQTLGLCLELGNYITQKALLHERRRRWPMKKPERDETVPYAPCRGGTSGIVPAAVILFVPGAGAPRPAQGDGRETAVLTAQTRVRGSAVSLPRIPRRGGRAGDHGVRVPARVSRPRSARRLCRRRPRCRTGRRWGPGGRPPDARPTPPPDPKAPNEGAC